MNHGLDRADRLSALQWRAAPQERGRPVRANPGIGSWSQLTSRIGRCSLSMNGLENVQRSGSTPNVQRSTFNVQRVVLAGRMPALPERAGGSGAQDKNLQTMHFAGIWQ
jgi:hypothetical protein